MVNFLFPPTPASRDVPCNQLQGTHMLSSSRANPELAAAIVTESRYLYDSNRRFALGFTANSGL